MPAAMLFATALGVSSIQARHAPGVQSANPVADSSRRNISYLEAKPALDELRADLIPDPFAGQTTAKRESKWDGFVSQRDRAVRARLDRGDEDSVINLRLYGTTFTSRPRVTELDLPPADRIEALAESDLVQARIADLAAAAATPASERIGLVRQVAQRNRIDPATPEP